MAPSPAAAVAARLEGGVAGRGGCVDEEASSTAGAAAFAFAFAFDTVDGISWVDSDVTAAVIDDDDAPWVVATAAAAAAASGPSRPFWSAALVDEVIAAALALPGCDSSFVPPGNSKQLID